MFIGLLERSVMRDTKSLILLFVVVRNISISPFYSRMTLDDTRQVACKFATHQITDHNLVPPPANKNPRNFPNPPFAFATPLMTGNSMQKLEVVRKVTW